jgi:hypothetical protein
MEEEMKKQKEEEEKKSRRRIHDTQLSTCSHTTYF